MTQQFGNSLERQGNRLSSEFCLAQSSTVVHPVKKKRGRPRKALPLNILSSDFPRQEDWVTDQSVSEKNKTIPAGHLKITDNSHVDSFRKKIIVKKNHGDYFDSDYFDSNHRVNELPFHDEELVTLEELEKFENSAERNSTELHDFKRIDQPAKTPAPVAMPNRKKKSRRRQIDPSTCERDYSRDEVEFMNALNEYKRTSGRMFPTCSEILEVLKSLGYEKCAYEQENDET
ncbi:MAG: hypothetical protein LBQ50_02240 [Planctomycetaceae bacterium]|jgi:hypothetical protein|nr:hypothetical protein [Planctomycetaceae bacterium]